MEQGAMNSESRKRMQERQGEPEARLLTEHHPVYIGAMTEAQYRFSIGETVPSLCQQIKEEERICQIREELSLL